MNEEPQVPEEFDQQEAAPQLPAPGVVLREVRESRGESLSDVAFALKLSPQQVDALEGGRLDQLPGLTFAKGFYRNYARYLGVDIEPLITAFWSEPQARGVELAPVRNAVGAMPSGGGKMRFGRYAAWTAGVLAVVLALGWYFDGFRLGEDVEIAPTREVSEPRMTEEPVAAPGVVESTEPEPLPEPEPLSEDAPVLPIVEEVELPASVEEDEIGPAAPEEEAVGTEEIVKAEDGGSEVVFRLDGEAWLEVRDEDGRTVYSGLGQGGSVRRVQGEPPLHLTVGNAAQVRLEFNGAEIDLAPHTGSSGVARLELE